MSKSKESESEYNLRSKGKDSLKQSKDDDDFPEELEKLSPEEYKKLLAKLFPSKYIQKQVDEIQEDNDDDDEEEDSEEEDSEEEDEEEEDEEEEEEFDCINSSPEAFELYLSCMNGDEGACGSLEMLCSGEEEEEEDEEEEKEES